MDIKRFENIIETNISLNAKQRNVYNEFKSKETITNNDLLALVVALRISNIETIKTLYECLELSFSKTKYEKLLVDVLHYYEDVKEEITIRFDVLDYISSIANKLERNNRLKVILAIVRSNIIDEELIEKIYNTFDFPFDYKDISSLNDFYDRALYTYVKNHADLQDIYDDVLKEDFASDEEEKYLVALKALLIDNCYNNESIGEYDKLLCEIYDNLTSDEDLYDVVYDDELECFDNIILEYIRSIPKEVKESLGISDKLFDFNYINFVDAISITFFDTIYGKYTIDNPAKFGNVAEKAKFSIYKKLFLGKLLDDGPSISTTELEQYYACVFMHPSLSNEEKAKRENVFIEKFTNIFTEILNMEFDGLVDKNGDYVPYKFESLDEENIRKLVTNIKKINDEEIIKKINNKSLKIYVS